MKTPKYVIAPEGCEDYLTPGKRYEVIRWWSDRSFIIRNDMDNEIPCSLDRDGHTGDGDWTIADDEAEAPEDDARCETDAMSACRKLIEYETRMADGDDVRAMLAYADASCFARAALAARKEKAE